MLPIGLALGRGLARIIGDTLALNSVGFFNYILAGVKQVLL